MTERAEFEALMRDMGVKQESYEWGQHRVVWESARRTVSDAQAECGKSSWEAKSVAALTKRGRTVDFDLLPGAFDLKDGVHVLAAADIDAMRQWQPIETAPKSGRTLLLGYRNSHGNWRTTRGEWMSEAYIAESWEDPDDAEPGWYETSVEADDAPNCWPITPTHWMPLPDAPDAAIDAALQAVNKRAGND